VTKTLNVIVAAHDFKLSEEKFILSKNTVSLLNREIQQIFSPKNHVLVQGKFPFKFNEFPCICYIISLGYYWVLAWNFRMLVELNGSLYNRLKKQSILLGW